MICWVYSLESPRRGDSNEYIQHTISWSNKKTPYVFVFWSYRKNFVGTQKHVRISHGKRAIGVRAIAVQLYLFLLIFPRRSYVAVLFVVCRLLQLYRSALPLFAPPLFVFWFIWKAMLHDFRPFWLGNNIWAAMSESVPLDIFSGRIFTARDAKFLYADNKDSDQTVRMRRLIWAFVECTYLQVQFLTLRFIYDLTMFCGEVSKFSV